MKEETRFQYESLQDAETLATYFQSLIKGFQNGRIILSSEEGELELHPKDMLTFSVKAKKKDHKTKLTLRISWNDVEAPEATLDIRS